MNAYQEMYCRLFAQITETIKQLQAVQQETEEMYLEQEQKEDGLQPSDSEN